MSGQNFLFPTLKLHLIRFDELLSCLSSSRKSLHADMVINEHNFPLLFQISFFFFPSLSPHLFWSALLMCLFLWYFLWLYQWFAKNHLLCSCQGEGGDSVPLFCSCGTPIGVLFPALGPPAQEGNGSAGAQQEKKDQKDVFMVFAWKFTWKHISHLRPPSGTTATKKSTLA